ncbi:MAG TPA: LysM peptidoglycan-binding domain-containing protein [Thermodesulfobacteriota bacterium]|nr:LysM peptidoglycan-binding domain-containing protein [Thermodesulfobacteriota bacterium]
MRLKSALIALLLGGMAFAQGGLPEPKGGVTVYVIRPGDTLWDISKKFFNNPLLWPRLWQINPFIDNPNLIYPGELLSLKPRPPALPVVKITPQAETVSLEEVAEPPPPVFYYSRGGHEGFIAADEWEHMGTVLSSEPPKILLGEGDTLYVNVGWDDGVMSGDKFTVFRTSKVVLNPLTGKRVGYKVAILGEVEIAEVLGKKMSSAKIIQSYREITRGARVRPAGPVVKEVVLKKGTERLDGIIVETLNNIELSGQWDIVYIDVGEADGVVPGNTFSIYTLPRKVFDPDAGTTVTIPPALKGKLAVLNVHTDTATGIILQSSRQIEKGDMVSLDL